MLIQKAVSPYLGTYSFYSSKGSFTHSYILEKHFLHHFCSGDILAKNPVGSKSYNVLLLSPAVQPEVGGTAVGDTAPADTQSEMIPAPTPRTSRTPQPGPTGDFIPFWGPQLVPCPSRLPSHALS